MSAKKKWTEEGVSPVIGTILMVAITVVLAAVLDVMVGGITPPKPKPTIGLQSPDKDGLKSWNLGIADVTSSEAIAKYKVMVMNGSNKAIQPVVLGNPAQRIAPVAMS